MINPQSSSLGLGENLYRMMQTEPFGQEPDDCERYAIEAVDRFSFFFIYNFIEYNL